MSGTDVLGSKQTGLFVEAGVDKIRLTGGEPTVRSDLAELVRSMRRFPGTRCLQD